ncbi:MAG: two-component system response regulator [Lysobacterales bacterium CG17_big_fil_post_rev_8_21_14_2_50_64_11]|nr:MAG: two-component system response regulator [Xanthomonadales bacterium CG17_big_fil_post_rev_8_21_14_2_50_64_11]PIX60896.1 MAG: two-component system response regulator [Xanthomonadales bacterium CG_4_10_14_3_um_filter_64_11]
MTKVRRILVIDDDDAFRSTLARALTRRGYQVDNAADGASGVSAAKTAMPDAIVLDLKLGQDNGLSLIRSLLGSCPDARIVLATGYASIATAVDAVRRGAWGYLPKPFTIDALLAAFEDPDADGPPPEPVDSPPSLRRLSWEHIQRMLAEADGNVSAAARLLGIDRRTLQRRLHKRPERERG